MKIWINDTQTASHRLIKLNCEKHSDFMYLGDFDDTALEEFFQKIEGNIDIEKNMKLIKYYGYLHLFIIHKKEKKA